MGRNTDVCSLRTTRTRSLLVTTEPNRISHKVPRNVERYINIFQANSPLGGFNTETVPDFRGHVATFDLAKHSEVSHVNMEKDGAIQEQVMNKILELAETPAKAESQSVPIHYVVPADAAIELWDSGRPVTVRSGVGNACGRLSRPALVS